MARDQYGSDSDPGPGRGGSVALGAFPLNPGHWADLWSQSDAKSAHPPRSGALPLNAGDWADSITSVMHESAHPRLRSPDDADDD